MIQSSAWINKNEIYQGAAPTGGKLAAQQAAHHQRQQTMGGKPQQLLNSKIQFNAPMMTKQPQKHAANQYVDNRGGVPHVDVASAAVGRMNYGAATSSGQPSPIISTKRVP